MTYIDPSHKLLAHLPRLAKLQRDGIPAPINVEIDLSNRCSLGCSWCHFAYTHTRGPLKDKREKPLNAVPGGDLMDTGLAFSIIDQLALNDVDSITWTGGGEPTLHPDFDDIVRYVQRWEGLEQGIYTHGGHIDEERARLLKEATTFVYVSLDAANRDFYRRAKGVDRFDAALDGIRRLAKADGGATVGVGYLVTVDNWRDAGAAARVAWEAGADYIQFRPTISYTQENPGQVAEDTAWIGEAAEALHSLQIAWEYQKPGFVEADVSRFLMYRGWQGHAYQTCWWSALQTVITPNGKMWTCVNKREHPAAELGDLSVESFGEVWARRPLAQVNGDCRLMCRGHLANLAVDEMMAPKPHSAFV